MKKVGFHITVKGIVVFDNTVLLMKRVRPSTDGLGYWELPGGGLEYGESPVEALTRELMEETGLIVDIIKPVYTFTKIRENYQTIGIGFLCQATKQEVAISNEHTAYRFCNQQEAKKLLAKDIYEDIAFIFEKR